MQIHDHSTSWAMVCRPCLKWVSTIVPTFMFYQLEHFDTNLVLCACLVLCDCDVIWIIYMLFLMGLCFLYSYSQGHFMQLLLLVYRIHWILVASQALALFASHYFLPLHKVKGNITNDAWPLSHCLCHGNLQWKGARELQFNTSVLRSWHSRLCHFLQTVGGANGSYVEHDEYNQWALWICSTQAWTMYGKL